MNDPIPCPFCGGEGTEGCYDKFWVECSVCHACGPVRVFWSDAVDAWNHRGQPQLTKEEHNESNR